MAVLKGKGTRPKPAVVTTKDVIELPPELTALDRGHLRKMWQKLKVKSKITNRGSVRDLLLTLGLNHSRAVVAMARCRTATGDTLCADMSLMFFFCLKNCVVGRAMGRQSNESLRENSEGFLQVARKHVFLWQRPSIYID